QGIVRSSARESPEGAWRSQSLTVLSQLPLARVRLSAEKATLLTFPLWPRRVYRGVPPGVPEAPASQSFTVPSQLAEASQWPSGLKATPLTRALCPVSVTQAPAWGSVSRGVASQMRTV